MSPSHHVFLRVVVGTPQFLHSLLWPSASCGILGDFLSLSNLFSAAGSGHAYFDAAAGPTLVTASGLRISGSPFAPPTTMVLEFGEVASCCVASIPL